MITKAAPLLPPSMPTPPTYQKVNPADQPVIYWRSALRRCRSTWSTSTRRRASPSASRRSPASPRSRSSARRSTAVRVQLDPRALTTRGIGIDEVEQALSRSNVNLPTGNALRHPSDVQTSWRPASSRTRPPSVRSSSPTATARRCGWRSSGASSTACRPTRLPAVQRRALGDPGDPAPAGHQHVEVVDAIRALLPRFRQELPASVNLNVLYDRSVAIRESVHDVEFTLALAIGLVVMVIFLFLRNVSATIIPSLAVPLSIVGNLRRHVPARLHDRHHLADGAHLCVGFRLDDAVSCSRTSCATWRRARAG